MIRKMVLVSGNLSIIDNSELVTVIVVILNCDFDLT